MAGRPKAVGMEYFCLDCNAVNDIKIQKLMVHYGVTGYGVYVYLLSQIYKTADYELDITDDDIGPLMAKQMGITPAEFSAIVNKCVKVGLFDSDKFRQGLLTSNGIKKRAEIVEQERQKRSERYKSTNNLPTNSQQINTDVEFVGDKLPTNDGQIADKCNKDKDKVKVKDKDICNRENGANAQHTHFVKPTVDEIASYCAERNNGVDAQRFFDFYESKGWYVGKTKMKDWRACVRTWERGDKAQAKTTKWGKQDYDAE